MDIKELVNKLNYYRNEYYNNHNSIITDKEYDELYDKLVQMEKETRIIMSNSPTQTVGYSVLDNLQKIKHSHLMKSLEKTKEIDDLKSFSNGKGCALSLKMDGLTILLTYDGGKLIQAETRGNGEIGQLVTDAARHFTNIPLEIPIKEHFEIEGEAIITYDDFEELNKDGAYKNPRNLASGSLSLLNMKEVAARRLKFIAWKVVTPISKRFDQRLNIAKQYGFDTVPFCIINNIEQNIEDLKSLAKEKMYPIDGMVLTFNDIDYGLSLGETAHAPKHSIAYKFYDEVFETELLDITYDIGRTGQLTPVAIFKPIEIDGATVERASLHNQTILKETLHSAGWIGQKLGIVKKNCIIPQCEWAEDDNELTKLYIDYPHFCPICGELTSIHKDNDSEVLYCDNPNCEGKIATQIAHFVSKNCFDIKGLSRVTIEKLLDWGFIKDKQSIFELSNFRKEWINKAGFGEKSVDKILQAIEDSKNIILERVIAAAGIPEVGISVSKILAKNYNSWEDFRAETDFTYIEGIGDIMNNNLITFDYTEIDYIVKNYLQIIKNNDIINIENNLEGLVIVITGKLQHGNRSELKNKIESLGGKVTDSVSSKTSMLINNDVNSSSSKNVKAKQLNVPIITEQEFYEKYLKS